MNLSRIALLRPCGHSTIQAPLDTEKAIVHYSELAEDFHGANFFFNAAPCMGFTQPTFICRLVGMALVR